MMLDGGPGEDVAGWERGPKTILFFFAFVLSSPSRVLTHSLDEKNEKSRQPQVTESAQRETGTWGNLVWTELSEGKWAAFVIIVVGIRATYFSDYSPKGIMELS